MPSPFPGMDPYLVGPEWEDFHTTLNTVLREQLSPGLLPKYVARVERRVYIDRPTEVSDGQRVGDVAVGYWPDRFEPYEAGGTAVAYAEPTVCELPETDEMLERREAFLTVRSVPGLEIVTVIETLSPANKRPGRGRELYLEKRDEVVASKTSLVELDLLRGGRRLPLRGPVPPGDYYALVSPGHARPRCEVYGWGLREAMPTISVPLLEADGTVPLDLQAAHDTVYERAIYGPTLQYDHPPSPPFDEDDAAWAAEQIASGRQPSP